jgi:hypothetical protein
MKYLIPHIPHSSRNSKSDSSYSSCGIAIPRGSPNGFYFSIYPLPVTMWYILCFDIKLRKTLKEEFAFWDKNPNRSTTA